MKMFWFFNATTEIPWPFKACGIFQMGCDMFLGLQFLMYGDGEPGRTTKEQERVDPTMEMKVGVNGFAHAHERGKRTTPVGEKDVRLG